MMKSNMIQFAPRAGSRGRNGLGIDPDVLAVLDRELEENAHRCVRRQRVWVRQLTDGIGSMIAAAHAGIDALEEGSRDDNWWEEK